MKIYATLLLAILGFSIQLNAQTLKNIHRHNQPVLRIPTHLIDKVETAEVQGAPHLRVIQFNGYVSEIPLAQIDSITHSEGQAVDPAQLGNLRTASVMGVVSGPTGAPEMNAIVRSPFGGEETRTDPNGVFFLNNILVYDKLGYITITKPGFHQGSRSFLPLETGSNRVNVQLLPMTQSGSFNAASGGTVTSGLLQLNFPANAVTLNGQPYNGTVRVYVAALDPTSPAMFDQMPGELLGGMNDSLQLLRSFGMASVELRDANMNELQLANGVSATMTFNIPSALQAEAPATIDWWSFDEVQGIWMHEGVAQKQGNQYIGQASHFSWWNVDVPANFNNLSGTVNAVDGNPISDAQVNVVSPTMGTGITYTNGEGVFTGRVPKNQQLTLKVYITCITTADWGLACIDTIYSTTQELNNEISVNLDERFLIHGTALNCNVQPVSEGYAKMGSSLFSLFNGTFSIFACFQGEYTIQVFDISDPTSIKGSSLLNISVGSEGVEIIGVSVCTNVFGVVSDIDQNTYCTVLIGNQMWMAENLKTTRFADGSSIPNVIGNNAWSQLTTPSYCYYENNAQLGITNGALYNWYTTVDSRNICPLGWHVPSIEEWDELIDFLGGIDISGGKIKAISGWNLPNVGATNESLFYGIASGNREAHFSGVFQDLGYHGVWWSSSQTEFQDAISVFTKNTNDNIQIPFVDKSDGVSIRCIKD